MRGSLPRASSRALGDDLHRQKKIFGHKKANFYTQARDFREGESSLPVEIDMKEEVEKTTKGEEHRRLEICSVRKRQGLMKSAVHYPRGI